ncbi:MAG: CRISPR-associated helicase Cas3' [Acidobacteriia bacterium]|nr:CRISPR-associated helicase Cas3' [Terriglobia bacterium]
MDDSVNLLIWAKTEASLERSPPTTLCYHPLLLHLTDVAAVATEMWMEVLSPAFRQLLADSTELPDGDCRDWLAFVAGTHDLGKCTPEFQRKSEPLAASLIAAGILSREYLPANPPKPHGLLGTALLCPAFAAKFNMTPKLARQWASVAGGHHGVFPARKEIQDTTDDQHPFGAGQWNTLRAGILDQLIDLLRPTRPTKETLDCAPALSAAGLVSVADWIASNQRYFRCAAQLGVEFNLPSLTGYFQESRERARRALRELGWRRIPEPRSASLFELLFPGKQPRESQARIEILAGELSEPAAILIEAPMGEGKTEAALLLADRLAAAAGQRGFYFGLPTQATSNQLFTRVCEFLDQRYHNTAAVPIILAHGHANLSPEFLNLLEKFLELSSIGEEGTERVFAASWFVQSKRALLTPFGVGTIDQALMASLITKHVFVRLFGLAGKVLVIDEVHAYDAYMSTLLERLLEWLGALRCSVVLLSATLPTARRNALLQAWAEGATGKPGTEIEIKDQRYPRVSVIRACGAMDSFALPVSERSHRSLGLRWLGWDASGATLIDLLSGGGCAAVICNTVAQAQETYRELRRVFDQQPEAVRPELELFHARFILEDRQRIEKQVFERFGPGNGARPGKAVLVATQVVEQSLDLDFDLMVSELAPVDFLLQRSGRLHRHERNARPQRLATPCLWIIDPGFTAAGIPDFGRRNSSVYQPYILLRTWMALRCKEAVCLPDDVEELIEGVYGSGTGSSTEAALREALERMRSAMDKDIANAAQEARNRFLPKPHADVALSMFTANPLEEDNPEVHQRLQAVTRLAEASVQVVCLFGDSTRPSLDAAGHRRTDLCAAPSPGHVRELLLRSVSVADKRLVFSLAKTATPVGWAKSAMLRFHKPVVFDSSARAEVNGCIVELDPLLGFRVLGRAGA